MQNKEQTLLNIIAVSKQRRGKAKSLPYHLQIDKKEFLLALNNAAIIAHAESLPKRELAAIERWIARNFPKEEQSLWLENEEIRSLLFKARQQSLTLYHIKEYDAMVFRKTIHRFPRHITPKTNQSLLSQIQQQHHYVCFFKKPEKLPFNLVEDQYGEGEFKLNTQDLKKTYHLKFNTKCPSGLMILDGEVQENDRLFLRPQNQFDSLYFDNKQKNSLVLRQYTNNNAQLSTLTASTDFKKVAELIAERYQHLNTPAFDRAMVKIQWSSSNKGYRHYVNRRVFEMYNQHVLPFLGFTGERRKFLEFIKKNRLYDSPSDKLEIAHSLSQRLTDNQVQLILRYKAFLALCGYNLLGVSRKELGFILARDSHLISTVFLCTSMSTKAAVRKIKIDGPLNIQPRLLKALQKMSYTVVANINYEENFYYTDDIMEFLKTVGLMEPSALPRNANDWVLLIKLYRINANLTQIKNIKKFCQKIFGKSRPTQRQMRTVIQDVRDYKSFVAEILKNSHLNFCDIQDMFSQDHQDDFCQPIITQEFGCFRTFINNQINNMAFTTLVKESNYWHENINRIHYSLTELKERQWYALVGHEGQLLEQQVSTPPLLFGDKTRMIHGITFSQLVTEEEFKKEGFAMHHCVSGYYYTCLDGLNYIFSLKDGEDYSTWHIRLDQILTQKRLKPMVVQHRAIRNSEPSAKHLAAAKHALTLVQRCLTGSHGKLTQDILDYVNCRKKQQRSYHIKPMYTALSLEAMTEFVRLYPSLKAVNKIHSSLIKQQQERSLT